MPKTSLVRDWLPSRLTVYVNACEFSDAFSDKNPAKFVMDLFDERNLSDRLGSSVDLHVLVDMFDAMMEKTKECCSEAGLEDSDFLRDSSPPITDTDSQLLLEDTSCKMSSNDRQDGSSEIERCCGKAEAEHIHQQSGHESSSSAVDEETSKDAYNSVKDMFADPAHLETVDELDIMKNSSGSLSSSYLLPGASRSTINSISSTLSMSTAVEDCSLLGLKNRSLVESRRPLSISSSFSSSSRSTTSSSSGRGDSLPRGLSWAVFLSEESEAGVAEPAAHGRKLSGTDAIDSGVSSPEVTSYLTPTGSLGGCDRRSELVAPAGSAARGRARDYCSRVVEELVKTEADYVRDLQQVLEGYLFYWRENPQPCLTDEQLSTLFLQLHEVAQCNSEFLMLLRRAGSDAVLVSECFMKHAPKFTVYISYCTDYPNTLGVLSALMRCEESARLFRERQQSLGHALPLGSYLLKPVQRILKYRLLLENMLSDSEGGSDAHDTVSGALATMSRLAELINDMKRRHELAVRVQEIQSILYLWPGEDLTTYGELLAEGAFRVPRARNWRHLFLFDTMLLITKRRASSTLIYKCHIMCSNLMLTEVVSRDPCMFQVLPFDNPKQQTTLQARTLDQKSEWTLLLKKAILQSFGAEIPGHARELVMKLGQENSLARQLRKSGRQRVSQNLVPEYLQRRHSSIKAKLFNQAELPDQNQQQSQKLGQSDSLDEDMSFTDKSLDHDVSPDHQQCESSPDSGAGTVQHPALQRTPRRKSSLSSLTNSTKTSVRRSLMLLRRQSEPLLATLSSSLSAVSPTPSTQTCDAQYVDLTSSMMSLQERAIDAGESSPSALTIHTHGSAEYVSFADYDVSRNSAPATGSIANDKLVPRSPARWHLRRSCRWPSDSTATHQRELPFMGSWRRRKHAGPRRASLSLSAPAASAGPSCSWAVASSQQSFSDASHVSELLCKAADCEVQPVEACSPHSALPSHRVYGERVSPLAVHRLVDTFCMKLNTRCRPSSHADSPDGAGLAADLEGSDFYEKQLEVLEQMAPATVLEAIASDEEEMAADSAVYSDSDSAVTATPSTDLPDSLGTDYDSAVTATASTELPDSRGTYSDSAVTATASRECSDSRGIDSDSAVTVASFRGYPESCGTDGGSSLVQSHTAYASDSETSPDDAGAGNTSELFLKGSEQTATIRSVDGNVQTEHCVEISTSSLDKLKQAESRDSRQIDPDYCQESSLNEVCDGGATSSDVSPRSSAQVDGPCEHVRAGTPSVLERQLRLASSCRQSTSSRQFSIGAVKKLSERRDELARHASRASAGAGGSRLPLSSGWVLHVVGKMETSDSTATSIAH